MPSARPDGDFRAFSGVGVAPVQRLGAVGEKIGQGGGKGAATIVDDAEGGSREANVGTPTDQSAAYLERSDGIKNDDRRRSRYVRDLLRAAADGSSDASAQLAIPRVLIQYWHDASDIPPDVQVCMSSWDALRLDGLSRRMFDDRTARAFISEELTEDHVLAFELCHHPAMRCDYFRLCYLYRFGGLYVDADDVMLGDVSWIFDGARLKLRPLCYDLLTESMVDVEAALRDDARLDERVFYFNNNPLAAPAGHPVVTHALDRATAALLQGGRAIADIQSTTGPGNLTACVVRHDVDRRAQGRGRDFEFLMGWDDIAVSVWPLSYRDDERNWRRWRPDDTDLATGCGSRGPLGPTA